MVRAKLDSSVVERNWKGGTFFKNETTLSVTSEPDDDDATE